LTSGNDNISFDEQKNNQKHLKRKLNIFLFCLILASAMWLMIRLSRDYSQNVIFSVNYKGIQQNNILVPSSDTVLVVTIQTSGYNIIYNRIFPKKYNLSLDLKQYTPKIEGDFFEINIETKSLTDRLASYFSKNDRVISVLPSNLKIKLEKAFAKKVPVKANVDITYAKQFSLYKNIFIEPDSVFIIGNKKLVDTIKYISTEKKELKDLSANTYLDLKLISPLNKLSMRYSTYQVKMYIPVAQYTEEFVDVPIIFDSIPLDYQIIPYPDKVRCYFFVSIPDYNKISSDSFKVGCNEAEIFHSKNNIARVILKKTPSFSKLQRIEPENIEFLIRKK